MASDLYGDSAKGFRLNCPAFEEPASDHFAQEVVVKCQVKEDGHKPDKCNVERVGVIVAPQEVLTGSKEMGANSRVICSWSRSA